MSQKSVHIAMTHVSVAGVFRINLKQQIVSKCTAKQVMIIFDHHTITVYYEIGVRVHCLEVKTA